MPVLSKPKPKIKRVADYSAGSGGYTHDNGRAAFGDHIYDHNIHNKEKYRAKAAKK